MYLHLGKRCSNPRPASWAIRPPSIGLVGKLCKWPIHDLNLLPKLKYIYISIRNSKGVIPKRSHKTPQIQPPSGEHYRATQIFSKSKISPLLKIRDVHLVAGAKSTRSNWQKGDKLPKAHPWKIWNLTRNVWHGLTQVLSRVKQCRQPWLGTTISPKPDPIFPWNSHELGSPRYREEISQKSYGEMRTFGRSARARTRAERNGHVFDVPWQSESMPRRSTPRASRRATPDPAPTPSPTPSPTPIKLTKALTVHPRSLSALPKRKFTGGRSAHGVPAAARALTTVDRTLQPSSTPSNPSSSLLGIQWSSSSPRTKHYMAGGAGLRPTAGACRPSYTVSHSLIPCAYITIDLQWSSSCGLIKPYRRELAGAHVADETDRLCTRPALLRPSPSAICPSTWPPGAPGPHPTHHRTSPIAGKLCHRFLSQRLLFRRGGSIG
jgi:hypothetical protein